MMEPAGLLSGRPAGERPAGSDQVDPELARFSRSARAQSLLFATFFSAICERAVCNFVYGCGLIASAASVLLPE
jgi:hypothetical protein